MDIKIVKLGEAGYPALLEKIKDPPAQLYYAGNLAMLNEKCAAVVGSRVTNAYGRHMAGVIGSSLAEHGATVVSGMALGIDTCAHEGALRAGGNTAAVLGCGIDVCYPPENIKLKEKIENRGVVISEYAPGTPAHRYSFPRRNRIISGLCELTVVVQARNRSGALITAELAAEQGREIMAVPGNIDSQYNLGSNKLIKEGAMPVISVDDVLEPLDLRKADMMRAGIKLSDMEYNIFQLLNDTGEMNIDEICLNIGKSPAYVAPILSVMEMKGFVFSHAGKIFLANT